LLGGKRSGGGGNCGAYAAESDRAGLRRGGEVGQGDLVIPGHPLVGVGRDRLGMTEHFA
jgi:hypothetical protein